MQIIAKYLKTIESTAARYDLANRLQYHTAAIEVSKDLILNDRATIDFQTYYSLYTSADVKTLA